MFDNAFMKINFLSIERDSTSVLEKRVKFHFLFEGDAFTKHDEVRNGKKKL